MHAPRRSACSAVSVLALLYFWLIFSSLFIFLNFVFMFWCLNLFSVLNLKFKSNFWIVQKTLHNKRTTTFVCVCIHFIKTSRPTDPFLPKSFFFSCLVFILMNFQYISHVYIYSLPKWNRIVSHASWMYRICMVPLFVLWIANQKKKRTSVFIDLWILSILHESK